MLIVGRLSMGIWELPVLAPCFSIHLKLSPNRSKACDVCLFHFFSSSRSKLEVLNLKLVEKWLLDTDLLWRQLCPFLFQSEVCLLHVLFECLNQEVFLNSSFRKWLLQLWGKIAWKKPVVSLNSLTLKCMFALNNVGW